ncbi:MAG: flagellar export chaperone FlgN [Phycisphaerales bacterium]|nr:flagellar export chaperone FlgN [Phycisphaerales bacterium]
MPPAHSTPEASELAREAQRLLTELVDAYTALSAVGREQRMCLARADGAGVERCAQRQLVLAQRVAELDHRRQALCGGRAVPISALVERLPAASSGPLRELTARARELIARVGREYRVVHQATRSLLSHMDGVVQQVARRLSQTGAYGPGGRIDPARAVAGGLDMTL